MLASHAAKSHAAKSYAAKSVVPKETSGDHPLLTQTSPTRFTMKILVVDDHALIRDALRSVLKQIERRAMVVEAPDGRAAIEAIESQDHIGLVLLDLNLPDRNGLTLLAELRQRFPATGVVVLSALQDHANIKRALDLGALGYIPKSAPREVMLSALRLVFAGGVYIPREALARGDVPPPSMPRQDRPIVTPSEIGLSERQLEVLALLMQGKSNKIICRTLNLMEPTVKHHVAAILRALKVTNRTQAVVAANDLGWPFPTSAKM
jgi:DNA-binding NarL/FixJ family response regulator